MRELRHTLRRRLKRKRWAREQRDTEARAFCHGMIWQWHAVRAFNALSRVYEPFTDPDRH